MSSGSRTQFAVNKKAAFQEQLALGKGWIDTGCSPRGSFALRGTENVREGHSEPLLLINYIRVRKMKNYTLPWYSENMGFEFQMQFH